MTPKLELLLGKETDLVPLKIQLPFMRRRIAVLVSGGLDSALLYYLLKSLVVTDSRYSLTPYTIERNDGSSKHAQLVIDYVNSSLGCDAVNTVNIPIDQPDSNLQVFAGMTELMKTSNNLIYVGLIKTLPEHTLHGVPPPFTPTDSELVKYPLKNLTKMHIVDAIAKLKLHRLFELTHSCVYEIDGRCNTCNRCNERAWAFSQIGLIDPGTN